jgi:hypothetical protein
MYLSSARFKYPGIEQRKGELGEGGWGRYTEGGDWREARGRGENGADVYVNVNVTRRNVGTRRRKTETETETEEMEEDTAVGAAAVYGRSIRACAIICEYCWTFEVVRWVVVLGIGLDLRTIDIVSLPFSVLLSLPFRPLSRSCSIRSPLSPPSVVPSSFGSQLRSVLPLSSLPTCDLRSYLFPSLLPFPCSRSAAEAHFMARIHPRNPSARAFVIVRPRELMVVVV